MSKPRTASLADLQTSSAESLRRSFLGTDAERTDHLRDVAAAFVDAREHFYTKEGDPDWNGRTYAYRTWVREVMGQANVPSELMTSTQAAIRYHVGNILRDRLDDDQLADLGLRKESPRQRSVEKRERTSLALALVSGGQAIETLDEIQDAATAIIGILKRVNVGELPEQRRKAARAALQDVESAAREAAERAQA